MVNNWNNFGKKFDWTAVPSQQNATELAYNIFRNNMMSNGASKSRSDMELVTKNNMQPNLNQSKWDSWLIIFIMRNVDMPITRNKREKTNKT